jgi:hypothetical protein
MVVTISEKRCGCYMHLFEHNVYNEALEAFLILLMNSKNPMGKLAPQLPGVVTFAYDLRFMHVIARWKGLS